MKVYVDCAYHGDAPRVRVLEFIQRLCQLDEFFEKCGVEVLRLTRKREQHDTNSLVKEADCIVVLCDYPSAGLSQVVAEVAGRDNKPVFSFLEEGFEINPFGHLTGVVEIRKYNTLSEIPRLVGRFMCLEPAVAVAA